MRVNPELLTIDSAPMVRRRQQPSLWGSLIRIVKVTLVLVVAAVIYCLLSPTFASKQELMRERGELDQRIAKGEKESADLDAELASLQNDPDHLARFARDRLNVARPGETVFRFEAYKPGGSDTPPATPSGR
ncbi:MAG TPA: septum formation initiator family protein [Verrucomicrobiae bacterium]|nr:septum formation initiator family protein [Verrucomicrobiae bacterium]